MPHMFRGSVRALDPPGRLNVKWGFVDLPLDWEIGVPCLAYAGTTH